MSHQRKFDGKRHSTVTGRVVYDHKPRIFTGRDMTRIVIAVNNNDTGNAINWRATYLIAMRQYHKYFKESINGDNKPTRDKDFEVFLKGFDVFVSLFERFFAGVPGCAEMVTSVASLYRMVREVFPVE